jgi:CDP-diacylglycerol--glycerol-3-phosphate 3-phosphatidyltransferase
MQWLWLLLLPVTLFLRMALNAIDGMLAREHGQKSRLGALLNELSDVASDAAVYLPFAVVAPLSATAAVLAVVLAALTEMTGVVGQTIGSTRRYDGPMGKSDRAFAYGLLAFLLGLGLGGSGWTQFYQWAIVLLLLLTIWNRARKALAA